MIILANSPRTVMDPVPLSGATELKVSLSHWEGAPMDMDLEVSYDNGSTWLYGGGCKGAISSPEGIEFHLKYGQAPTHVKGVFSSDKDLVSTITISQGG